MPGQSTFDHAKAFIFNDSFQQNCHVDMFLQYAITLSISMQNAFDNQKLRRHLRCPAKQSVDIRHDSFVPVVVFGN